MKKSATLSATAGVFVLALVVGGAAVGRSQAIAIKATATLNAAQEVPAPTHDVSASRGTFSASVTKSEAGGIS